jgi:PAS domain S-box-containing protein
MSLPHRPFINLLLVEDNPDDAFLIREMLSEAILIQCQVEWVDLFSRGRQQLEEHPGEIDLVLLDLFLPDSRGMDTLLDIKPYTPHIPIVVLTGLDNEEMGRQAIKEGAQDYICKNDLNPSLLENSLHFAIERHQLMLQLEKKKNQLAGNEQRLRRIIEKNADGILILDREGRIIFTNPAAGKILNKKREEMLWQKFDYPLTAGEPTELTISKTEGNDSVVEMQVKEIDWEGKPAYLASLRDISERKELEHSLLVEKERLDITLRSIGDGVIATDKNGNIVLINPSAAQMTGWSQEQASGQPIPRILNLDIPMEPESWDKQDFSFGTSKLAGKANEILMDYSRAPILDKENHIIGHAFIIRDTTIQRKMIEEMIKVRKLESLGMVAGKLAHDFDNVFTVILGNLAMAKNHMSGNERILKMLDKSEKTALRAKSLTNQLHTFSRVGGSYRKSHSIIKLIREVSKDLQAESTWADTNLQYQWNIADELWEVEFDRDQLYTALRNIMKNGKEAMPGGGRLDISIENAVISEKKREHLHLHLNSGSYVKISIRDHGSGIDREILKNIFDPFFTTKEKATGMGLTTAFSIIRDHEGTIEVESEKDAGSTFTLFLPSRISTGEKS